MSTQPGWHPDPVPPQPGQPALLRYWDGTRWTEHTAPAQPPAEQHHQQQQQQQQYGGAPAAYQGVYGAAAPAYAASYGAKQPATTPDGVPLAGWWQRVLALVIDSILVGIVGAVLALPWIRDAFEIYTDWFDAALDADGDSSAVDTGQLQRDLAGPLAVIGLINLALGFAYHVGFLMWKQATPGKLVVGLRVRLRERPGPMPFRTVLVRWLLQFGPGLLAIVPYAGSLSTLYSLLDYLWPLWDDKKQAIHDKVAKTNVVRVR